MEFLDLLDNFLKQTVQTRDLLLACGLFAIPLAKRPHLWPKLALGIPASNAITMFYKQIILQRGLPFEVKLPEHPLDVSRLTDAQLDAELEKGYAQYRAGQAVPAQQAFADIRKGLAHEL